jgi:hypothetical protein
MQNAPGCLDRPIKTGYNPSDKAEQGRPSIARPEVKPMTAGVAEVAEKLAMPEDQLVQEGIRAVLRDQIALLEAERRVRCAKFGVTSLEEMDALVREGRASEEEILEDFQQVDYLTARIEELRTTLQGLR